VAVGGWKLPAKLARAAQALAGIPARAAGPIAVALNERVLDTYRNEQDPYGNAWAPLAASTVRRKHGNTVILYRSGASGADCGARAIAGAGVAVWAGGAAKYHQEASGSRPARPVLPDRGLPPKWRADIAAVLGKQYAAAMGRATR